MQFVGAKLWCLFLYNNLYGQKDSQRDQLDNKLLGEINSHLLCGLKVRFAFDWDC